jgi:AcrR family transcriptional regulator
MGVTERRAREKEEMRGRILHAAAELFVEEGYESVSMRRIADKIEYSPSTIYLYFKDKSELCHQIVSDTFDLLSEALEKIVSQPMTTEERLRRCLRTYIEFGISHPQHYIFSLNLPEPDIDPRQGFTEESMAEVMNSGMRAFEHLRQGLARSMDDGIIRRQPVDIAAQTTWAMLHGLTSLMITCKTFPWVDRELLKDNFIEQVMRSLR